VGACQRPGTQLPIGDQDIGIPSLEDRADLHVPQLADIDVAPVLSGRPAQKNVGGGLHQTLPRNDAVAVVLMRTATRVRFEDRRPRFLDLQEQRVIVRRHEQTHGALGANAANPDDLDRQVVETEAVEQHPDVLGQRLAIRRQRFGELCFQPGRLLLRRVKNQRGIVLDPGDRPVMLRELREDVLAELCWRAFWSRLVMRLRIASLGASASRRSTVILSYQTSSARIDE